MSQALELVGKACCPVAAPLTSGRLSPEAWLLCSMLLGHRSPLAIASNNSSSQSQHSPQNQSPLMSH